MDLEKAMFKSYSRIIVGLALLLGVVNASSTEALAQSQSTNSLLSKISQQDAVIPAGYGKRKLTSFEKYRIQQEIDQLNQSALKKLEQGNDDDAFEQWYRYLKLTRVLSAKLEVAALGEVGAIAWQKNRGTDVRNIAERLSALQTELMTKGSLSEPRLKQLATAYQQLRYVDRVIAIYQQILNLAAQENDAVAEAKALMMLGELYLARFDYDNAAKIYEQMLALSNNTQLNKQSKSYLHTLIEIYDRTGNAKSAITSKQRLIKEYQKVPNPNKIPALEIAIARDYETLKQQAQAINTYERAFKLASQTQQLAIANDALTQLGKIYLHNNQEQAIATYRRLLKLQQQSYDHYGLINTHKQLGNLYLQSNQKSQAKQSFQQGLKLAQSLDYQVEYFQQQVRAIP